MPATQLAELVPLLLTHFARSSNPDAALLAFDRFLSGLHGAGRLFSLLRQNPDLIALIAMVLGTAPRLADSLAQFPDIMDAVIDPSFFGALPEEDELQSRARPFAPAVRQLRGLPRPHPHLRAGADVPDRHAHPLRHACRRSRRARRLRGSPTCWSARCIARSRTSSSSCTAASPGQEVAILAMGKLGGREMTATSDLDLIVIYDFDDEHPESDGPRPLYGAQYFTRLVQRLISALTAQTNYGVLYQVDMRLRPSGRSGPVATRIDSFASYQETEAWTWEHMALTRARVVSASPAFRGAHRGGDRVACSARRAMPS